MSADIDELLGEAAEPEIRQPTRRRRKAPVDLDDHLADRRTRMEMESPTSYLKPVTPVFLARVFNMHPTTVTRRLEKCPVAEWGTHQNKPQPRYKFATACSYLVKPRVSVSDWMQSVKDFPPELQKAFWSGQREKNKWQTEAGELWHTQDVVDAFGAVFLMIKETSRLWVDQLPGQSKMTTEQYTAFQDSVNSMIADLQGGLNELLAGSKTLSVRERFEEEENIDTETPDADA